MPRILAVRTCSGCRPRKTADLRMRLPPIEYHQLARFETRHPLYRRNGKLTIRLPKPETRVIAMIDTATLSDEDILLFIELRHMWERARAAQARARQPYHCGVQSPSTPGDPASRQDKATEK